MMLPHTLSHPYAQFQKHRKAGEWSRAANYLLDFFEAGVQYVSIVLLGMLRDEVLGIPAERTPKRSWRKLTARDLFPWETGAMISCLLW